MQAQTDLIGKTVFFTKSEEYWDKPYARKRNHIPCVRSVILQGTVTEVQGQEFKALLHDNNGFEKDGQESVFGMGSLLCNQNFTDHASLGTWQYQDIHMEATTPTL